MTFTRLWLTKCFVTLLIAVLSFTLLASAESKEKVLYSFQGGTSDGAYPAGGVVFDKAGNLYGATTEGGPIACVPAACGSVFQLTPPVKKGDPWTETVLHIFKGNGYGDGSAPAGSVIIDSAGNLYGTTAYGGTGDCVLFEKVGCGTVYELSPPAQKGGAWTETVLYSFPTSEQGYLPNGNLVFDGAGNLYGATMFGGGYGTSCDDFYQYCGAVFELSPPTEKGGAWTEKVLHGFRGMKAGSQNGDGANPNGGLVFDSKGAIYGTTYTGGFQCPHDSGQGCGTVFRLTPPIKKGGAWTETVLHRFLKKPSDGGGPAAGVVFDKKGKLYCTTLGGGGGNYPSGAAIQLVPDGDAWVEHVLHSFQDNGDGSEPRSGLTFDSKGNLYGTASGGGWLGGGTFFSLRPAGGSWSFSALYDFGRKPDGNYPVGSLIFDGSGNLYGTTQYGGDGQACGNYGCGTVFSVTP
jgi:hypothetical protein